MVSDMRLKYKTLNGLENYLPSDKYKKRGTSIVPSLEQI